MIPNKLPRSTNLAQPTTASSLSESRQCNELIQLQKWIHARLVAYTVSGQRSVGLWRCFSINLCPLEAKRTPLNFMLLLLLCVPKPLWNSPQLQYLFIFAGTLVLFYHFGIICCCCWYWTCAWHLTSVNDAVSAHLRFSNMHMYLHIFFLQTFLQLLRKWNLVIDTDNIQVCTYICTMWN